MLQEKYAPHDIEAKWQKYWEEHKTFKVEIDKNKPKSYVLEMFPYPSGNLHMGHVRNYSIGDVVARFRTMKGFNVLHPMGWDSFGMPAENAAIKHGIPPKKWTLENIANMTRQQKALGLSYDWDREVATCKEDYYKWTQWFFELFYKRGLAYKKKAYVNWCETCGTVLANEQVIEGKCWRCDSQVIKKTDKKCPHCGAPLAQDASFCPHCTATLAQRRVIALPRAGHRRSRWLLLAAVIAAAAAGELACRA